MFTKKLPRKNRFQFFIVVCKTFGNFRRQAHPVSFIHRKRIMSAEWKFILNTPTPPGSDGIDVEIESDVSTESCKSTAELFIDERCRCPS